MSLTNTLGTRIIVGIQTIAIVVLAVVVVIYAQVLVQQHIKQEQIEITDLEVSSNEEVVMEYSIEERLQVLDELMLLGSEEIVVEDRQVALETLASEQVNGASIIEEAQD